MRKKAIILPYSLWVNFPEKDTYVIKDSYKNTHHGESK